MDDSRNEKIHAVDYDYDLNDRDSKIVLGIILEVLSRHAVNTKIRLIDLQHKLAEGGKEIIFEAGRYKCNIAIRVIENGQSDNGNNQTVWQYIGQAREFLREKDIKFMVETDSIDAAGCFVSTSDCNTAHDLIDYISSIQYNVNHYLQHDARVQS